MFSHSPVFHLKFICLFIYAYVYMCDACATARTIVGNNSLFQQCELLFCFVIGPRFSGMATNAFTFWVINPAPCIKNILVCVFIAMYSFLSNYELYLKGQGSPDKPKLLVIQSDKCSIRLFCCLNIIEYICTKLSLSKLILWYHHHRDIQCLTEIVFIKWLYKLSALFS